MVTYHIHGNGFLQFDLGGGRIHVWHDSIPRQTVYTGIHNHRFGFKSKVLLGELRHRQFDVVGDPQGNYQRYQVEGKRLVYAEQRIAVIERSDEILPAGTKYTFPPGDWHENLPATEHLVTLFEKTDVTQQPVYVAVPIGQSPDNAFTDNNTGYDVRTLPDPVVACIMPYLQEL